MTLTLTHVPKELDEALRMKARAEGKSVDEVVLEIIRASLTMPLSPKRRALSEFGGAWVADPETEAALAEQDKVEETPNLDHLFTPERLAQIDAASVEIDAGNSFTAEQVREHFKQKRASWGTKNAGH